MRRLAFLVNLQAATWTPEFRAGVRPDGFLYPPADATRTTRIQASEVRAASLRLMADNGNFPLISLVAKPFEAEVRALHAQVDAIEQRLGRSARGNDLPPALRDRFRRVAVDVEHAASAAAPTVGAIEARLSEVDATSLIGPESFAMACFLRLGIEPAYLRWPRTHYAGLNRAVIRQWHKVADPTMTYAVASAISYNSAFDAGRRFAAAKIPRVAMGFGAYMHDDSYMDYVEFGRRVIDLGRGMPARYVRTAAVSRGFFEGYRSTAGKPPTAFHFLGLGAPRMMAIAAVPAWGVNDLTFDATSPIQDATQQRHLYVSKPSHQSVDINKVAFRLASEPEAKWDCPCPFCASFANAYPFDYARAWRWMQETGATTVATKDLQPRGALYAAFPLFAEPAPGPQRRAVNIARIGHNHWVIEELITMLRRPRTRATFRKAVFDLVERYAAGSKSTSFAASARASYAIAAGLSPFA